MKKRFAARDNQAVLRMGCLRSSSREPQHRAVLDRRGALSSHLASRCSSKVISTPAALQLSCAIAKPQGRLVVEHRVDWRVVLHGMRQVPAASRDAICPFGLVKQVPAAEDLARIEFPVAITAACGASWR